MTRLFPPVFWVISIMIVGLMGTTLITPLYGLYKAQWHLAPSDITQLYVVYMLGALFSLLVLGRLPDRLGYRRILLAALLLSMIGNLVSMLATTLPLLMGGRFLVGVASSLATSAGAVALQATIPERARANTALIYSVVMATGFGIGPLIGGIFGQSLPAPLFSAYLPPLICAVLAGAGFWTRVKEQRITPARMRPRDLIPSIILPQAGDRLDFLLSCGSAAMAFCVFGLYAAMSPFFIETILHLRGPLASGLSTMAILLISSLCQVLIKRLPAAHTIRLGLVCLILGNLALIVNLHLNSAALFGCGVIMTALGHGASLLGSMVQLNARSTKANRAGLTSSYMIIGYLGSILASLGLGWLADGVGVSQAVTVFAGLVIASCAGLGVLTTWRAGRRA